MSALSSIVDHLYEMSSSCIYPNLNCCPHLILNLNRVYNFQYRLSSKFVFNPRNSLTTTPKFGYFEHYSLPDFSVSKQFFFASKQYHKHTNKQHHIHHQTYSDNLYVLKRYNHPTNEFLDSSKACFKD